MTTLRAEQAVNAHGVEARAFAVIADEHGRILNQTMKATRYYEERGRRHRITAELRFDDGCGNGHESFAITADIRQAELGVWREYMGGCCHDEIVKHFPELAPLVKWHLCSTDGPMHYIPNTVYHAGDRDHRGLRKGEQRQLVNGRTKEPCWRLMAIDEAGKPCEIYELKKEADGPKPERAPRLEWQPWMIEGEGKQRELGHARTSAVWPEATDEELCQDPDALRLALAARLPALLAEFKAAMLAVGFIWPAPR